MTQTFEKGQIVNVLNCTLSGKYILEGRAKIIRRCASVDDEYSVDFLDGYGPAQRYIDPLAQNENVSEYIDYLNGEK